MNAYVAVVQNRGRKILNFNELLPKVLCPTYGFLHQRKKYFLPVMTFFPRLRVDFHQSEGGLVTAQPMGGQEIITVSVGVIPQEEASRNNITKF